MALGQAYMQMKKYQEAVNSLKKGQALAPQDQKVNYQLGMALAAQKRYPEALEAFLKAGDEAQAYNNIGVHYFGDGRYEEAAKCFQKAIDLRPTFYQEARNNLQRALEKLHQSKKTTADGLVGCQFSVERQGDRALLFSPSPPEGVWPARVGYQRWETWVTL